MRIQREQSICEWAGVTPDKPASDTKINVALSTIGNTPINGFRQKPHNGNCGWYIWCGDEIGSESDFFEALDVKQIEDHLPDIEEYLLLPSGYRFLIDQNNFEDVWLDKTLL